MVKIRVWEGGIEDMDKIAEIIESGKCFYSLNFWYAAYIIYNCASNSSFGVLYLSILLESVFIRFSINGISLELYFDIRFSFGINRSRRLLSRLLVSFSKDKSSQYKKEFEFLKALLENGFIWTVEHITIEIIMPVIT